MGDRFRDCQEELKRRLKRLSKGEKKSIFVLIGVSIFVMGVFFHTPPRKVTLAKNTGPEYPVSLSELVPEKKLGTLVFKDSGKKGKAEIKADFNRKKTEKHRSREEDRIAEMISGHPMEVMAPHIAKRKKEVASFLVAIAKKESNWGRHSPQKSGRDCYNYWGYKGGYNLTASGYSCFDSPEQAIEVVGNRIEDLLGKKIDTPNRMVVWKCGRTCEGHDPKGVAKWISDVALYYQKLNS